MENIPQANTDLMAYSSVEVFMAKLGDSMCYK
jgi:hypothetical protein